MRCPLVQLSWLPVAPCLCSKPAQLPAQLGTLTRIRSFSLHIHGVDAPTPVVLTVLSALKNLDTLSVCNVKVTPQQQRALRAALPGLCTFQITTRRSDDSDSHDATDDDEASF